MSSDSVGDEIGCRLFIGGLDRDSDEIELQRAFEKYGRVISVWVSRERPGFGFVIFHDERDAEDAVHGLNGKTVCGVRIRVEMSTGSRRNDGFNSDNSRNRRNRARPFDPKDRCFNCQERGHYAYDCPKNRRQKNRFEKSRRYSRSPPRRSRSRSPLSGRLGGRPSPPLRRK